MQRIPSLFFLLLVFLLVLPVTGAGEEKVILYQTDFSADPGWMTNNPSYYYWDVDKQVYHFQTEGGTNGYSFIPVTYDGGPFVLEFDVIIESIEPDGAFRFGITGTEMDISRGTVALAEFGQTTYGEIMSLLVIDPNNHLYQTSSRADDYCGQLPNCYTREFVLNTSYHVAIRYNDQMNQADIKVTNASTGERVWGYFVSIGNDMHSLSRLAITTKGDYAIRNTATGSIDNVVFSTFREVTPTPTTVPTTVPTTATPTRTPTPTPTPTASAGSPGVLVLALVSAGGLIAWFSRKR
ncbi:MAG: hypothetical protein HGA55_05215 [Methanoregulaceae archaeon]|nr:hypothetical protein [Methanoregulaceae archaeon]